MRFTRSTAAVILAATAVLGSAGGAYAYWRVSGAGTGTVAVATVTPLEVKQFAVTGLVLGRSVPLTGEVRNPNDFEASLIGTHFTVTPTVDQAHRRCTPATNFEIVAPTTKAKSIPANGTVEFNKGTITLLDTGSDQAVCQGATLTLDYLLK